MKINRFTGLDNQNDPLDVGLQGLTIAKNVDIDRKGQIETRNGFALAWSGLIADMWNNLVLTMAGDLVRINPDGDFEQLSTGLSGDSLTGVEVAGNTYFSTGAFNGVITGSAVREMGLPYPIVSAVSGVGNLLSGRYLITATTVAPDGRESGAPLARVIDVADGSSIVINVTTESGYTANIYMSGRDGEELYFMGNLNSLLVNEPVQTLSSNDPIDRQYKGSMPEGTIFEEYRGHLLVAYDDNYLCYSDPLDYELCSYINNIYPFDSAITMVVSVEHGVFVSTKKEIFYASGETPESWVFRSVYASPAKAGTGKRISLDNLGEGAIGYGAMFVTEEGTICVGMPDGGVQDLTHKKFKLDVNRELTAVVQDSKYVVATV